jgi:hypothetical protein
VSGATIAAQGIVAIPSTYLLYPAVGVDGSGNATMIFGESSSMIYPTVAFATGSGFSSVQTLHSSPTYDVGFSCSPCRWGDYSAAVASTVQTSTIWMATEDLMAQSFSNGNWSTRIAEVVPQGG